MKKWFSLSKEEQRDLIRVTAGRMKMDDGIIEKDVWLLAVLNTVFNSKIYGHHFIFKGGTSLSKVFDLIHRFSEDIDLIMNWDLLGYSTRDMNPWKTRSRTRQDKFNKNMNAVADEYLTATFAPWLQEELSILTEEQVPAIALGEGYHRTSDCSQQKNAPSALFPALLRSVYAYTKWHRGVRSFRF